MSSLFIFVVVTHDEKVKFVFVSLKKLRWNYMFSDCFKGHNRKSTMDHLSIYWVSSP